MGTSRETKSHSLRGSVVGPRPRTLCQPNAFFLTLTDACHHVIRYSIVWTPPRLVMCPDIQLTNIRTALASINVNENRQYASIRSLAVGSACSGHVILKKKKIQARTELIALR